MKHNRFFRILAMSVILALLMLAIPITPALGAVTGITLSATSGPPGTPITVTGTGSLPADSGYVWFDSNSNEAVDSGEPFLTATVSATPLFTAPGTMTVPTVPRGPYYVRADVPYTAGTADTYASFIVVPEITANVSSGHVGDTVLIDGAGFAGSVSVTFLFDDVSQATTTTTTSGTFDNFSLTIPASTEGNHTIKVWETATHSAYDTDNINVTPQMTMSPISGAVGDTITVSGNGFDGASTITIYFDSASQTTTVTNSAGTFTAITFDVPSTSRGAHIVKARDTGANEDTATFTVAADITLNPTSGPSGTTVTVTGTGFGTSRTVNIKYDNVTVTTSPPAVTTGSTGGFTATFTVPVGAAGTYVVQASDATNTATANFVSTTSATISQTTTTADPGHVGMSLTITGVGFTPSHAVTVTYATTPVTLVTVTSDSSGNFTATFTIPPSLHGAHVITVSDTVITRTFDFVMESNPPPVPAIVLPLVGEKAKSETVFDWGEVTDPEPSNPVTYDLQVATDATFSSTSLLINETGLTQSAYTIPGEDKLESTGKDAPYYWRVRAVDAASNASAWSEPSTFTVGFSFEFTGWVVWVTMVVVAILFFLLGLWIGRRGGDGGGGF